MNIDEIAAGINARKPGRDWHMECQALVYWAGVAITGSEAGRRTYGRAIWAYDASKIISLDPTTAPAGAIHYWERPIGHGHVAVGLGGESVLMSGTPHELGAARRMLGTNYGTTTVSSFMARGTQKYLGWARTNGDNPTLIGLIGGPTSPSLGEEEDEDMRYFMIRYTKGGEDRVKVYQTSSGFEFNYETRDTKVNNKYMKMYGVAEIFPVDESEFNRTAASLAAVRQGK